MKDNRADLRGMSDLADEGIRLADAGFFDQAIEKFRQALTIKDDEGNIRYNLGLAYLRKSSPTDALEEFKLAMRFEPLYADSYFAVATVYKLLGPAWKAWYCYLAYLDLVSRGDKAQTARNRLQELGQAAASFNARQWLETTKIGFEAFIDRAAETGEILGLRLGSDKPESRQVIADGLRGHLRHEAPNLAYNWAVNHFNAANNLLKKNKYRAAFVQYIVGIELFPHEQLVLTYLSGAFAMAGEFSASREIADLVDLSKAKPETKVQIAEKLEMTRQYIAKQTSYHS
jgi:hypothetical protein